MAERTLLTKASQALAVISVAAAMAVPLPALAQYAVSDTQLTSTVSQAIQGYSTIASLGIQVHASQGVVTLSGNVPNEEDRTEAEQVAGGVEGVKSIQDNLTVNGAAPQASPTAAPQQSGQATPPPSEQAEATASVPPDTPQTQPPSQGQPAQAQAGGMPPPPPAEPGTAESGMPPAPPSDQSAQNQGYGGQQGYGQPNGGYPQQGGWGPRGNASVPAGYNALGVTPQQQNTSGPVTIPAGSLLSIRTSEPLSTGALKKGEVFQATAASDTYENGVVAVPRGAVLTGVVVEAKNAGAFGGRPRLDLQLTSIQLGPTTYPVASQVWSSEGPNKAGYTASNAAGGAIFGALVGAIAGGGVGAGVGAIAGGAGGAAISGATHGPRLDLPPEALLEFHLTQPLTVQPVRYEVAQQIVNSAPPAPRLMRRPAYVAPYPPPYPYYGAPYPY